MRIMRQDKAKKNRNLIEEVEAFILSEAFYESIQQAAQRKFFDQPHHIYPATDYALTQLLAKNCYRLKQWTGAGSLAAFTAAILRNLMIDYVRSPEAKAVAALLCTDDEYWQQQLHTQQEQDEPSNSSAELVLSLALLFIDYILSISGVAKVLAETSVDIKLWDKVKRELVLSDKEYLLLSYAYKDGLSNRKIAEKLADTPYSSSARTIDREKAQLLETLKSGLSRVGISHNSLFAE